MSGQRRGSRSESEVVVPAAPTDEEKASYAWRALPYLTMGLAISALCLVLAQVLLELNMIRHAIYVAPVFIGLTASYVLYQGMSLPLNFAGRSFDLDRHAQRSMAWRPKTYPTIDIFLPICGEPLEVLTNTWAGVHELIEAYPGLARAFVLDDGDSDEAEAAIPALHFSYIRRRQHTHKKAGNLNYAFARTCGEMIVVFDADFRPRADFLAETLPYLDDDSIGIVQTPQFFRVDDRQTWVERAAGTTLEIFYRAVQVSRDRFGSALCVGSNAVYRRAALAAENGFKLIPYAEDSHTGLMAREYGYELIYLPVPLAAGVCPSNLDMYMRQQYRWCCGATSLIWTSHMWRVSMPMRARLPYVAGWLWNFNTALRTLVAPLLPVCLLLLLPQYVQLRNVIIILPAVLTGVLIYPLWHTNPYSPRIWSISLAVGWAQTLALWDFARGNVMSWQPSRGPKDATRRFWWGVTTWNGTLALAWVALVTWRLIQTDSPRFAVAALFGLINLVVVFRLILPEPGLAVWRLRERRRHETNRPTLRRTPVLQSSPTPS